MPDQLEDFVRRGQAAQATVDEVAPPATPAARWRQEGKPDPHGTTYDCERAKLAGGQYTDDEVAFRVAMLMRDDPDHEGVLLMAKDRIRWLSRKLVEATAKTQKAPPASQP